MRLRGGAGDHCLDVSMRLRGGQVDVVLELRGDGCAGKEVEVWHVEVDRLDLRHAAGSWSGQDGKSLVSARMLERK